MDFDDSKYYLGSLCKRGHDWNGTGKSLRYIKSKVCYKCSKQYCKKYWQKNKDRYKYYYKENKEVIKRRKKLYQQENKEYFKEYQKKYYQENKEAVKQKNKQYYQENKEAIKRYHKDYHQKNKETIKRHSRNYYQENKEEIKKYKKQYYQKNKEIIDRQIKRYRQKNKEFIKKYYRKYQKNKLIHDFKYKLNCRMSSAIYESLKANKNGHHWETLVNFKLDELKQHLENQFKDGMTWDNYGDWHIDHIIPISLWEFNKPEDSEFKQCWALTNLQPLWAEENLRKSNNI